MNYEEKATFEKRRQSVWDEVEKKLVYRKKHHYNKRKSRTSNKHILYWPYIERKLSSDEPDSSFDTMLGADCSFDTDQRPTPNAMGYVM